MNTRSLSPSRLASSALCFPGSSYPAFTFLSLLLFVAAFMTLTVPSARGDTIFDAVQRDDANAIVRFINADRTLLDSHSGQASDTPLHLAARLGRANIVSLLLKGGAKVNSERYASEIALSDAVAENHPDVVKLLLQAGANVDHQDNSGMTPLMWAADRGLAEIANLILDAGASINTRRTKLDGCTALHLAVLQGRYDVIQVLIKRQADVNTGANDGGTPLHMAANLGGRWGEARLLAAAGANLEARNDKGDTPLHVAARKGMEVLRELLSVGANTRAQNKAGLTPREEAQRVGRMDCADIIRYYENALREHDLLEAERNSSRYQVHTGYAKWKTPGMETREVYRSHFEDNVIGTMWQGAPGTPSTSPLRISKTPVGSHPFLGDFVNQEVRLSLDNLPPHQEITVFFDLYLLRTWDGNNWQFGPDLWTLAVADGPTLIHTTFVSTDLISMPGLKIQAYPGNFPADFNPARAGASEINTLGYIFSDNGNPTAADMICRMQYTLRHDQNRMQLRFSSDANSNGLLDESWGLTNVRIAVGVPATSPTVVKRAPSATRPVASVSHAGTRRHVTRSPTVSGHKPKSASTRIASKPKSSQTAPRLHDRKKPPTQ